VIGVNRTYMSSNIREGVIWSNTQQYSNAKVDELLEKAALETDQEKRKALYDEFQEIVVDESPIYFINVIPYATVYKKGLAGVPDGIWGAVSPMDDLHWAE
jgi:peptide/nickel transport system substrate-binding protein